MEKYNFEDAPKIVNVNESHMALLFLLDTSGSMQGKPIEELKAGINRFKKQVCEDERTKSILDVAIIEFNTDWRVIQEFTPVEYMEDITLEAGGGTNLYNPLCKAINMIDERTKFYRRNGSEPYKPWIVLISDGLPQDNPDELSGKINDMVLKEKMAFWSLAVPGANLELLHQLSGNRVLNLEEYDFKGFFDWVNKSMRAISVSSVGEKPKGQALPQTITIDELM